MATSKKQKTEQVITPLAQARKTIVRNAQTLNTSLLELFNGLNDGTINLPLAKELFNGSGKIIKLNMGRLEAKN